LVGGHAGPRGRRGKSWGRGKKAAKKFQMKSLEKQSDPEKIGDFGIRNGSKGGMVSGARGDKW